MASVSPERVTPGAPRWRRWVSTRLAQSYWLWTSAQSASRRSSPSGAVEGVRSDGPPASHATSRSPSTAIRNFIRTSLPCRLGASEAAYQALEERIPDARYYLEDGGHHPFIWTRPEKFHPEALAFLEAVD